MNILRQRKFTSAQAVRWKTTREKGRSRYILLTGILFWCGLMVIFMTVFQYWMNPESFGIVRNLGMNAVIFLTGGILFGLLTWMLAERNYSAFLAKNEETEPLR